MAYSLAVVQPRAARFFANRPRDRERFAVQLAAGGRRPVLAAVALLAASGAGLVAAEDGARDTGWWTLVALKAAGLCAAAGLFSPPSLRPSAAILTAIVALEFVLGAAAAELA